MRGVLNRIKGLFKIARLISTEEGEDFLRGIITYMGTEGPAQVLVPYGTMLNPPVGSQMMVFAQGGLQSNAIGIASDPKNRTLKDLEPAEYAVGNYESGSYMVFRNNGDIEINCEGDFVLNINGTSNMTSGGLFEILTTGVGATTPRIDLNSAARVDINPTSEMRMSKRINMQANNILDINASGDYSAHVHGGVTAGAALTDPPDTS